MCKEIIMGSSNVTYYGERYRGSLDETTCSILDQLIELDEQNGVVPDLAHVIYQLSDSDVQNITDIGDIYGAYDTSAIEKPLGTLRDDQTIGVAYMYYAGNLILGDSVGLGKTVETAGLINLLSTENKDFRYLVLTEKNLAEQFRSELVKFTGEYVEWVKSGEKDEIDRFVERHPVDESMNCGVVGTHALLTADRFLGWLEQSRQLVKFPFDMLVIDESSPLGGKSTNKIVTNFKLLKKYFKRIVFLNATPFESKLQIFYNQLDLLDSKLLPTKKAFTKEYVIMNYTGMYPKPTGKYKNGQQFKSLVGYRYFARTRKSKGAVMVDCDGGLILSRLSSVQNELLRKSSMNKLVYDCPTYIDRSIEFTEENVPKLASLMEVLRDKCSDADTVLIYVYYKEAQKYLSQYLTDRGYSCRVLNGDATINERTKVISGFKNKEFKILITNVQKGLNFGDCNYCIFYGFQANPSQMVQFEGRTTRSFDIVGKHVYILCSLGTEYNTLLSDLKTRTRGMVDTTNTDLSVVLSILLGEE